MADNVKYVAFFLSWIEAADELKSDAARGKFYTAVMHYAAYDKEPQLDGQLKLIFNLIRPFLDASKTRREKRTTGKTLSEQCTTTVDIRAHKEKEKEEEYEYEKENTLKECAPVCAYAPEAEKIARNYPPAKVGNWRELVEAVIRAVTREVEDRPGTSIEDALHRVENGTIAYADAVSKWKNKRYISDAVKFYDSGMYNHDPETWKEGEGKNFDIMNPETW